jgi:hypothetical protein
MGATRKHWHFTTVVPREIADESPITLDSIEQLLREHAIEKNTEQGLTIVSDRGIEWCESPNEVPADYHDQIRRFTTERAWTRGEPIEWDYLFCRLAGVSIPAEVTS